MENLLNNALLLDFYGGLLTQRQRDIYHLHFCEDMSFSEIGDRFGITRQAVNFSLKQTQKNLEAFEEALGMIAHHKSAKTIIAQLKSALEAGDIAESNHILSKLDSLI
ncbi:MAG: hypothetical protein FWE21_03825 [Defluviitaleaceae bacterium]|nr:hypothetical protein [Defluviitaleaceae bacterium]